MQLACTKNNLGAQISCLPDVLNKILYWAWFLYIDTTCTRFFVFLIIYTTIWPSLAQRCNLCVSNLKLISMLNIKSCMQSFAQFWSFCLSIVQGFRFEFAQFAQFTMICIIGALKSSFGDFRENRLISILNCASTLHVKYISDIYD